MTDTQFEAVFGVLTRIAKAIESLQVSLVEDANLLHGDLQDLVAAVDNNSTSIDGLAIVLDTEE
jgi:hypothetical protein